MFTNKTTRAELELWYSNMGTNEKYVRFLVLNLTMYNGQKLQGSVTVCNLLAKLVELNQWGTIKSEAFSLGFEG